MDKQTTITVASGGINLTASLMLFIYLQKRLKTVDEKLNDIQKSINILASAQNNYTGLAAPLQRQPILSPPNIPPNPQTSINMAHTISNMMDSVIGGFKPPAAAARPANSVIIREEPEKPQPNSDIAAELQDLESDS